MTEAFPSAAPPPGNIGSPSQQGALGPYLRAILSHPLIVGMVMLIALGGAVGLLAHRTPSYQATADILFSPVAPDNSGADGLPLLRESSDPTRLAQTAATLLDSRHAAVLAAAQAGAPWTPTTIRQKISVEPQGQSNIVAISAKASSAALAQKLANAFASGSLKAHRELLRAQATELSPGSVTKAPAGDTVGQQREALITSLLHGQDPNFSLAQAATLPSSPTGTSKTLIVLLALIAGFALGSGAAIATNMLSDRIGESEELLSLYHLPVLAYIPAFPRRTRLGSHSRANGSMPRNAPQIREAFQMIRVQLDAKAAETKTSGHVILLTSGSSGDGKTTSAINIATALADTGHSVILVDLDLRKPDMGRILHLERKGGVVALLDSSTELSHMLTQSTQVPTLSVLPAGTGAGENLLAPVMARLPTLIEQARGMAEYIVIDAPPLGEVSDAYQVLPLVDEVIVVARPGNTRRGSFEFMRELLNRAEQKPTGIVIVGETGHQTTYAYYGQT